MPPYGTRRYSRTSVGSHQSAKLTLAPLFCETDLAGRVSAFGVSEADGLLAFLQIAAAVTVVFLSGLGDLDGSVIVVFGRLGRCPDGFLADGWLRSGRDD